MYTIQPKKLLIINILDILKRYSDKDHRLSQREIATLLKKEYNMVTDRKAVKRNLMNLIDFGYDIEFTETVRTIQGKDGSEEQTSVLSDFYLNRDFTDGELRLLIDELLFSKHIPYSQCKKLIEKIEGLSSIYFKSKVQHIHAMPENSSENKQLFYTIEILDEAISTNKKVSFYYNEYKTDKKLHPRKTEQGENRKYIINPYQMVAMGGKYYLLCNYDKYDQLSHYRLDRISDIALLSEARKPLSQVKGGANGLNLSKHMAEHIYMFTGESIHAEFVAKKYMMNDLMDWFGQDITFTDETEDEVTAYVSVNESAFRKWAVQYALHVKVTSPLSLAEKIKEDLLSAVEKYQ